MIDIENLNNTQEKIPTESIVSHMILQNNKIKVISFAFAPGQELSDHTDSVQAIIQMIQAARSLSVSDKFHKAGQGTWVYMPANTIHSLIAETPMHMLLFMLQ